MKACLRRSHLLLTLTLALALPIGVMPANAQTQTQKPPAPSTAKPSTAKPSTAKPSTAKPAQPTAKPAAPEPVKAPAPPPPQDVRFKSTYTNGDMKTESVTYIKGARERFEFQDMVLLKQPDQKRTIQISKSANTYLVNPDGMAPAMVPGAAPTAPPKPPGVIMVATTIVDTGERKQAFGQQARHVKLMIDKQPMPGACDTSKQRIETDGWYIDNPPAIANRPASSEPPPASPDGCADQIQATSNGDPKALGFPIAYTTTMAGDDGKPIVSTMEVTEYEATTLDAALFEIPPGLNAAMNIRELSKALSDANEAQLVAATSAPPAAPAPKTAGVVRIGVPEFTNKTQQTVDTRALRQRLISDLTEAKFEAVPMPAGTPAESQKRASEMGADYVLFAEVSELKVNKPSKLGGIMGAASGIAGGRAGMAGAAMGAAGAAAGPPKENTESSIAVKLLQPDGKQRLSTTTKGKDGSGFSLKSGLNIAKYAGGMYLSMMAGPMMFSKMSSMGAFSNMGGMGMLGNPYLYQMQGAGLGGFGKGLGMDATAGAASYLMQSGMAMNNLGGFVGAPGQGPSYDESLGEAVQNAAKAVQKALEKK
jgi:hypothetical protein